MKNLSLLLLLFISSCNLNSNQTTVDTTTPNQTPDCNSLPATFSSYAAAVQAMETTNFAFTDAVNTSKSSWIKAARYYSCNKQHGYFIIETDKGNYLHKQVPILVWQLFKETNSFGSFYNANIKHRYKLVVN